MYLSPVSYTHLKGDLPDTAKFTTPGGGIRLLYKYPNHIELKTKVDRLEGEHSEVCFMSDGKQTLLPPSIHPNGCLLYTSRLLFI